MSRPDNGGRPARKAVLRWSLRMFAREWRQQVLITILVAVAVAATILGAGVISGSQANPNASFGTANTMSQLAGNDAHLSQEIASIHHHFGAVAVIDSLPISTGTSEGAVIESVNPLDSFVAPLVGLVKGRYPTGLNEVDLSSQLITDYGAHVGGTWTAGGTTWSVVGEVEQPSNLTATFALAEPGAIAHPASVTVLFNSNTQSYATFSPPKSIYNTLVGSISTVMPPSFNVGELILLIGATFGMLFIGLIAVAGFTVMARRRTRAIGMLGALGAPEPMVRLALIVNGLAVGLMAMVLGGVVGLVTWWVYAPHQQSSVGHVVDPAGIPWWVVIVALVMAPITTTLAARRPARAISRLSVVAALSGRPTEPQISRRNAAIGAGILGGGVVIVFAGGGASRGGGGGAFVVLIGIVLTSLGLFLVAQWIIGQLGRLAGNLPMTARIALRDLARYRSRSGAALGAICLALLMTGVVVLAATARYSDPFDWVGPNVAQNVAFVYPPNNYVNNPFTGPGEICGPDGCKQVQNSPGTYTAAQYSALSHQISRAIGATNIFPLEMADAGINRTSSGRNMNGPIYVATPALLAHYGISPSSINPSAMILTSRPGLPSEASQLAIVYGQAWTNPGFNSGNSGPCPPGYCVPTPVVQEVSQLPPGTSAPNTVLTMHAVHSLHLKLTTQAWQLTTQTNLTALQIQTARTLAQSSGAYVETANSFASLDAVLAWAIGAGLLVALGVLAMTVGLIRAESSSELRVLAAVGASRRTRRSLAAVTSATLGLVGAVLGVATAYLLVGGFLMSNASNNIAELTYNVPVRPLVIMLVGLPVLAALGGWIFAGREPRGIGRQIIE
jgi:putative ABC transport system permease protein